MRRWHELGDDGKCLQDVLDSLVASHRTNMQVDKGLVWDAHLPSKRSAVCIVEGMEDFGVNAVWHHMDPRRVGTRGNETVT